MKRRSGASPTKTRRCKRAARTPTSRQRHPSETDPNKTTEQLRRERDEALEQLAATSEVLRVISRSPTDVQPVFNAIAESATRLCDGHFSFVVRFNGDLMHFAACHGLSVDGLEVFRQALPRPASSDTAAGRAILTRTVALIQDVHTDPAYGLHAVARAVAYRSLVAVPLLRDGNPIGAISVARGHAGPFSERQISLLQTFAEQAVIAIENVRLFDEVQTRTRDLSEALEQQTATSKVLGVISSSPGDLEPVFQAMLENATRLCEAHYGTMWLRKGDAFRAAALHGPLPPAYTDLLLSGTLFRAGPDTPTGRVVHTRQPVQVLDLRETREYLERDPVLVAAVEVAGIRTMFSVPMLKEDQLVGTISIYRQETLPFTAKQIELVQNFAAQAVIAIENTRLLSGLRESLQQQTATADVLKVISSSPGALLESASRLCSADKGGIMMREGDEYRFQANYGFTPDAVRYSLEHPLKASSGSATGRVALEGRAIHIPEVLADPEYHWPELSKLRERSRKLKDGIGIIGNWLTSITLCDGRSPGLGTTQHAGVRTRARRAHTKIFRGVSWLTNLSCG